MTTDAGRSPSGRATHERSHSSVSPPPVGVPNALDALLTECTSDYRNALLDRLDELWLDGCERGFLTAPQLNAINGAVCELAVEWGLKGWHRSNRPRAIATEAQRAATVEQGAVHEGAGPEGIAQGPSQ